jgi:2-amino-4-hydroxy-6-hydroxymethyldihydropteridine diphosphokinase
VVPGNTVAAVSRFRRTEPVGQDAGGEFLNAAAEIDTTLSPLDLLDSLQSIELALGRKRTVRWGPRTIDLDLLFYGSEIIDVPRLAVPHPAAWYRRFVLDPLVEIAPSYVHPERQADIQTLHARLLVRPLVAAIAGGLAEEESALIRKLSAEFANVKFVDFGRRESQTTNSVPDATIAFWLGAERRQDAQQPVEFHELPVISRLDVTRTSEQVEDFVRNVLKSALG